jgi:D-glycero-alpha-D-manno-heptose-7-phosphate kinase
MVSSDISRASYMLGNMHSVSTLAPLRVSLLGGGTDFPEYFREKSGIVVSIAIPKYTFVTVKRHSDLFGERFRVSYSETEHTDQRSSIKNDICRACLEYLQVDEPLNISTSADLPAQSGLGSSSSFAVALLLALHTMKGERITTAQLAREACDVELNLLRRPMGIQDQYAAALGGMNALYFERHGAPRIEPLGPSKSRDSLISSLEMIWTGRQRAAESVLTEQQRNTSDRYSELDGIRNLARQLRDGLVMGDMSVEAFAQMLSRSWELKKSLASGVSDTHVDQLVMNALQAGALGAKLLGAGGGGFVLVVCPESRPPSLSQFLMESRSIPVSIENLGARVIAEVSIETPSRRYY